jgi:RHS repeat-associated protein
MHGLAPILSVTRALPSFFQRGAGLQLRRWCFVVACVMVTVLGLSGEDVFAQSAQNVIYGPKTAEITPPNNAVGIFADIDVYSPGRGVSAPFTLVIDNLSAQFPANKKTEIEIWHNLQKVAGTTDLFTATGKPIKSFQKALDVRPFLNIVIVKMEGKAPVRISYKIIAGAVVPVPPQIASITPNPLALVNGSGGVLNVALSPTPTAAGSLSVVSSNTAIASVPASVSFTSGQTSVAIPVQGAGVGSANISATLNGSTASASVSVSPAPARIVELLPLQATLQQGASGQLQVKIGPAQGQAITVSLTSSATTKVSVPASVSIPAGQTAASFSAQAVAVGNAQITATLSNGGVISSAASQVQVVPVPPTVISLLPANTTIQKGSVATMTVKLSAAQSTPTTVALLPRTAGIVSLPVSVVVPAGLSQASFDVQGADVGNTLIAAILGASTVEAAVQITPAPVTLASLGPVTNTLVVGASGQLILTLNAVQPTITTVVLTADPSGFVQVPGQVQIPAGQIQVSIAVTALAVGQADVVATLGATSKRATVVVTPLPAAIADLLPNPVGIQQGASANLTVRLNAAQTAATVVNLSVGDAALLRLPASVTVPAGLSEQSFSMQGLSTGSTVVTATLNGSSKQATINVTVPPPAIASLQPTTQDLPKGKVGRLTLTLDRAPNTPALVNLSNSNASALGLPAQVTIPAGQLTADVAMTALTIGQASVSASLNGSMAAASVNVVQPEIVGIVLNPANVTLTPGQSAQVQATGTYSDGSTQDISTGAGTAWSTGVSTIATISAQGRVTGVAEGSTSIQALQSVLPTYGNPTPSPVVGSGNVTVGAPSPLALSAAKSNLLVGESMTVSITSPYAAGSSAITVNLATSGTGSLQVPATATINPGLTSVSVVVRAMTAGSAVLQATAMQFSPGQLSLTITNPVATAVTISAISPTTAAVGATVTLSGAGFLTPAASNTVVFYGGAPAVVQSGTATQLVVKVPDAAQTGAVTVTNTLGSAQSATFTVLREQDFGLTASPSVLKIIQSSSGSAVLSLSTSGTRAYEGLAKLTASGLPSGVTAKFDPPSLSAVQTGRLVLEADASAPVGTDTVVVKAEAMLNGLPWVRESRVNVEIVTKANVTGVKGRFVTPSGQGIAGVIARQDITTNQVVTDAGGNFTLVGLPSGVTTLRFDATPANSLYPIWPYNVTLDANQILTMADWVINPPPTDDKFKVISNATQTQQITDDRYPGFSVVLPAGATITGWDGVQKTRIAVEKIDPDKLPVGAPPFTMKEAYQLYFGTPMGGIPSQPIPVNLPNVSEKEPGEKVDIWWFDGSPMGGTGEWKMAGLGTVSPDGKTVASDPGVGIPRFCGVCGLVSLSCPAPPTPPQPPPTCSAPSAGNPVDLYTGQELPSTGGLSCGGIKPIDTGMKYNPVDAFNNRAGTVTSFGYGWTFDYDISFLPFSGPQKRMIMPGGQFVNMVDDGTGKYRPVDDPRLDGTYAQDIGGGKWQVNLKGGSKWQFEPFAGITGVIRGGPPLFLTKMIDNSGNETAIGRQSNGRVQTISGADGRGMSFSYGGNGFVSRMTDNTGRKQDYEYTTSASAPRVAKITDAQNRVTQYTYQPVDQFVNTLASGTVTACQAEIPANGFQGVGSIKYPGSDTPTTNTYSTDRIVKQTTSTGEIWKMSYRRTGACVAKVLPTSVSNGAFTQTWDYTCRAGQPLASRTCSGGQCTESVSGTCPEVDSEENRQAGWRFYGGNNIETTVTKPDGNTTRTKFNARGLQTEAIDELGQSTKYVYDAKQHLVKMIDPLGREAKYEYDASVGNRIAAIDPLGRRVETAYETTYNNVSQVTQFLLGVPSVQGGQNLSYTPFSRSMTYDAKGNLAATLDPTGQSTQMAYNSLGQLSSVTLPAKVGATGIPIINGGTASTLAPGQRKVTLGYNAAGDISLITDALGQETRLSNDALGRQTGSTDPLGYSSGQQYNAIDQPIQSTNALGQNASMTYDVAGRVTAVINPAGVTIESYTYDAQGRLTRQNDALGQSTSIEYDSSNRPVKVTDRKGQVSTVSYTERGQVSTLVSPDRSVSYQYDATGRITEVRDAASVNSTQYDAAGRTIQTDSTTAAGSHRLQYQYDSLDRLIQRTLSGSGIAQAEVTSYSWDLAGRLLGHSTTVGGQPHATSYQYDLAGRLAARKVQAGSQADMITQRYGYDSVERLAQIKYLKAEGTASEQLIDQIDYRYDAAGRRTGKTSLNNNGIGQGETPMTATYDAANRMTALTLTVGAATKTYALSYDAAGNLTQKQNTLDASDKTTYTWDASNRLSQISQTGATSANTINASFTYDAVGRRIQSSIATGGNPAQTVQYLYEGQQALGEIRGGQLSHRLLTGLSLDETIARIALNTNGSKDATNSRVFMTDALNSVIAQLSDDSTASVQTSYAYSPYGEAATVGPDGTKNPIQYTSRENDQTGLMFYRARYYDPVMKRFISSDPIGLAGGMNSYSYVGGNPSSMIDPSGLEGIYRGPGNSYGEIPPAGGCQKPIWTGGYIRGWEPCNPPPGLCVPGASEPPAATTQNGGSAPSNTGSTPGQNNGPTSANSDNGSRRGGVGVNGGVDLTTGLLGCTATANATVGAGSAGISGAISSYVGCGLVIGTSGVRGARTVGSLSLGDPTGLGVRMGLNVFGSGGSIFVNGSGVAAQANLGLGSNANFSLTGGLRGSR